MNCTLPFVMTQYYPLVVNATKCWANHDREKQITTLFKSRQQLYTPMTSNAAMKGLPRAEYKNTHFICIIR